MLNSSSSSSSTTKTPLTPAVASGFGLEFDQRTKMREVCPIGAEPKSSESKIIVVKNISATPAARATFLVFRNTRKVALAAGAGGVLGAGLYYALQSQQLEQRSAESGIQALDTGIAVVAGESAGEGGCFMEAVRRDVIDIERFMNEASSIQKDLQKEVPLMRLMEDTHASAGKKPNRAEGWSPLAKEQLGKCHSFFDEVLRHIEKVEGDSDAVLCRIRGVLCRIRGGQLKAGDKDFVSLEHKVQGLGGLVRVFKNPDFENLINHLLTISSFHLLTRSRQLLKEKDKLAPLETKLKRVQEKKRLLEEKFKLMTQEVRGMNLELKIRRQQEEFNEKITEAFHDLLYNKTVDAITCSHEWSGFEEKVQEEIKMLEAPVNMEIDLEFRKRMKTAEELSTTKLAVMRERIGRLRYSLNKFIVANKTITSEDEGKTPGIPVKAEGVSSRSSLASRTTRSSSGESTSDDERTGGITWDG